MSGLTLFDKVWNAHCIEDLGGGRGILVIDRVLLHEVTGGFALRDLEQAGLKPRMAASHIHAVADHAISTAIDRDMFDSPSPNGPELIRSLAGAARRMGIRYAEPNSPEHGIVHVIAPEQGLVEPGMTLICGDSHTATLGAFGALAFGVGATDIGTALKHEALVIRKPKTLRICLSGSPHRHVTAKDIMLDLIARHGNDAAVGCVIEFAGEAVSALDIEARLTLCNMAAEMGTRYAMIAPDAKLLAFIANRRGVAASALPARWSILCSDPDARFERDITHDVGSIEPQVTWGTSPRQSVGIGGIVPIPPATDEKARAAASRALQYMQVTPGMRLQDIPIDAAFIGSCTNARLSDLRAAAAILKGRRIAKGIAALCTPGSMAVRAAAEAEGIDEIFKSAGFEWRMSGCSACAGREGPIFADRRVVSSTNRNYENRQGPGTRTHIASPATVAASAIAGHIADPRDYPELP